MTHADALEREAQLAWHEYCALIRLWVAEGRVSIQAGTHACDDLGKEIWLRAYLRLRRRAAGLGTFEELDELGGSR